MEQLVQLGKIARHRDILLQHDRFAFKNTNIALKMLEKILS